MNAHKSISACLAVLLAGLFAAAPAFAAPPAAAPPVPSEAQPAAPAADVFGVSVLSTSPECLPGAQKPQATGTVDPTQKCGACSQDGCKLSWIGVECGSNPRGIKICVVTSTATCWPDGGAICRCQNPD